MKKSINTTAPDTISMCKLLFVLKPLACMLWLTCLYVVSTAQTAGTAVTMTIQGFVRTAPNSFEYDIMLTNTGTTSLALRGYSCGLNHTPGLENGGSIVHSYIADSRDAILNTIPVPTAGYTASLNHLRLATTTSFGGNEVPLVAGVSYKLARMKVTTSAASFPCNINPFLPQAPSLPMQVTTQAGRAQCFAVCYVNYPAITNYSLFGIANPPTATSLNVLTGIMNPSPTGATPFLLDTIKTTACDSYTWSSTNQTYTASGVYIATGLCNTDVLDLTISQSTTNTTTITEATAYTWPINNQTYTATGVYSHTSLNAAGCVHTELLNLNIIPLCCAFNASCWKSLTAGTSYCLAISHNGTLWGWGLNDESELGTPHQNYVYGISQSNNTTGWDKVFAGGVNSFGIKTDGSLWAWGDNGHGALGIGIFGNVPLVQYQVGTSLDWKFVSTNHNFVIALKTNGSLWSWGKNNLGQLGDGTAVDKNTPIQIGSGVNWKEISSGKNFAMAIKGDGTLWAWGSNTASQLGGISGSMITTPTQMGTDTHWLKVSCGDSYSIALKTDGTLWEWGYNINLILTPTQIGTASDWTAISAGNDFNLALKSNGTMWSWGLGTHGCLGLNTTNDQISPTQIGADTDWWQLYAGKDNHALAQKKNGHLYSWGNNDNGAVGNGGGADILQPLQVSHCTCIPPVINGITSDINPACDNTNIELTADVVSMGSASSLVWTQENTTVGNGNPINIIANGTKTYTVKGDTSCLLGVYDSGVEQLEIESYRCIDDCNPHWKAKGINANGNFYGIKYDGTLWKIAPGFVATQIGNATDWKTLSVGSEHCLAIKNNGSLWAWGYNHYGQLGNGITNNSSEQISPIQIGIATDWKLVESGTSYSFAIKTNGTLWSWGSNLHGILGIGYLQPDALSPTQVGVDNTWKSISAPYWSATAIKNNGTLWAWGYNFSHYLGPINGNDPSVPNQIGIDSDWRTSCAGFLAIKQNGTLWQWGGGDNLSGPNPIIQVGNENDWLDIDCVFGVFRAIKSNGSLWRWGANSYGGVGDGTTIDKSTPVNILGLNTFTKCVRTNRQTSQCEIDNNGSFYFWGNGSNGNIPTLVYNPCHPVASICAWKQIDALGKHLAALQVDGTLWTWGWNQNGQLGHGNLINANRPRQIGAGILWKMVSCGQEHTVAIKQDGTLWASGSNNTGQLGIGNTANKTNFTQVGSSNDWRQIACGGSHTLAIKNNGTLWAWGNNYSNQLGDGTGIPKFSPQQIGSGTDWLEVECGGQHSLAIKNNGSLWSWGLNGSGECGQGNSLTYIVTPTQVGNQYNWMKVAAGSYHSLFLKTNGTLWACGSQTFSQLGIGTTNAQFVPIQIGSANDWKELSAGYYNSFGIKNNGTLWGWGSGSAEQFGNGTNTIYAAPTLINNSAWQHISSGFDNTIGIQADGTSSILSTGNNSSGQLGNGTNTNTNTFGPIACSPSLVLNTQLSATLFIQGYYINNHKMTPVSFNQQVSSIYDNMDEVTVELHDTVPPYAAFASTIATLQTDGTTLCKFPLICYNNSYYVVIKHRNCIETWSANPVMLSAYTSYDFTTASSKAYGSNQVEVEPGKFAIFSGDLNQDENIDLLDLAPLEEDINNFAFGYFATDINGDGNVDLLDNPLVEENINNFVFSNHP